MVLFQLMARMGILLATFSALYNINAFVEQAWNAAALFILDHEFFAMAIAIKSYFQKIADPADMANIAGVNSTINHPAAVFLPPVSEKSTLIPFSRNPILVVYFADAARKRPA